LLLDSVLLGREGLLCPQDLGVLAVVLQQFLLPHLLDLVSELDSDLGDEHDLGEGVVGVGLGDLDGGRVVDLERLEPIAGDPVVLDDLLQRNPLLRVFLKDPLQQVHQKLIRLLIIRFRVGNLVVELRDVGGLEGVLLVN